MGNKFKISNMIPSSWYSKLKQMNKPNTTNKTHPLNINPLPVEPFIHNRPSNYIPSCSPLHPKALDTHFPLDSPRKSDKIHRKLPNVVTSPRLISTSKLDQFNDANVAFDNGVDIAFELPKIITKSTRKEEEEEEEEEELNTCYSYRKIKARAKSPKVKVVQRSMKQRKCAYFSKSFVMIKNSSDPKEDFRQSMMEMIVENELKGARDLEELLACYLCLNSSEYHHIIVQAFEEIWFDAKLNKTVRV